MQHTMMVATITVVLNSRLVTATSSADSAIVTASVRLPITNWWLPSVAMKAPKMTEGVRANRSFALIAKARIMRTAPKP
ncbi:MAG: hypothetical protein DME28_09170 [Verrucomicrobia bacterium]|nr:MAG: hypothetical protein DME28_09170 [Verrucomicrobiota bacterium]